MSSLKGWSLILGSGIATLLLVHWPLGFPLEPDIVLGRYDQWTYFGPMYYFMDAALRAGEFPLWNPLTFCGTPFAANPQSAVFYPPNLLRSLLTFDTTPMGTHASLVYMAMGHLLFLAVGLYFLCRDHALSMSASLVAALGFMVSANLLMRLPQHWHFIAMVSWFPYQLLFLRSLLQSNSVSKKVRRAVALGLLVALSALVGFPQLTLYILLGLGAYGLLYRTLLTKREEAAAQQGSRPRGDILAVLVVTVTALAAAAPLLLPAWEFAGFTARTKSLGTASPPSGFQISPLYFVRGMIEYSGVTWPGSTGIRMMGTGALFLAFAALFHPRRREVIVHALLFLIFIDCALGPSFPIGRMLDYLAPFRLINPARATTCACFFLAILAGYGVDSLCRSTAHSYRGLKTLLFVPLATAILAFLYSYVYPNPYLPVTLSVWAVPCATAVALVGTLWMKRPGRLAPLFIVLVVGECLLWSEELIRYVVQTRPFEGDREPLYREGAFSTQNARGTSTHLQENIRMHRLEASMTGYDPMNIEAVHRVLASPEPDGQSDRFLQDFEMTRASHRGNSLFKRRFWLVRQYVRGPLPPKDTLFPAAATAYLAEPGDLSLPEIGAGQLMASSISPRAAERPVFEGAGLPLTLTPSAKEDRKILSAEKTLPAFLLDGKHSALRIRYTSAGPGTLDMTFFGTRQGEPQWQFGKRYAIRATDADEIVEYPLPDFENIECHVEFRSASADSVFSLEDAVLWTDLDDEGDLISIERSVANTVEVQLGPLPGNRLLVYLDAYYPGWKAYVDGEARAILKVNDAFKALEVRPGDRRVLFVFRSSPVYEGVAVAVTALVAAAAVVVGPAYRRKRRRMRPKGTV